MLDPSITSNGSHLDHKPQLCHVLLTHLLSYPREESRFTCVMPHLCARLVVASVWCVVPRLCMRLCACCAYVRVCHWNQLIQSQKPQSIENRAISRRAPRQAAHYWPTHVQ